MCIVGAPVCIKINHPREDKSGVAETCAFEKERLPVREYRRMWWLWIDGMDEY